MTTTRTLEQFRAEAAYKAASSAGKSNKEYKSFAKKLPMLIKNNGLGAALAFAEKSGKGIDTDIKNWLSQQQCPVDFNSNEKLSLWLSTIDSQEYRAVTMEVMAYLNWLRRFVDTLID
ncbi:MAG: type III-B CRISPR module-associated protein Cmr5 [Bacteroidia bacterium]